MLAKLKLSYLSRLPSTMFPIVWGQPKSSINRVFIIEKKAVRTTHFKDKFDHTSSLFSESNKIKFPEQISIENCLFVSKSLTNQLREIANNWFVFLCVSLIITIIISYYYYYYYYYYYQLYYSCYSYYHETTFKKITNRL